MGRVGIRQPGAFQTSVAVNDDVAQSHYRD